MFRPVLVPKATIGGNTRNHGFEGSFCFCAPLGTQIRSSCLGRARRTELPLAQVGTPCPDSGGLLAFTGLAIPKWSKSVP